jgi:hypothetical protein
MHRATALLLAVAFGLGSAGPARAADANSLELTATYEVDASFSWASRAVEVATRATVSNGTSRSFSQLSFNLATLRIGRAQLGHVTVSGQTVDARPDDQTVIVPLPASLDPGERVVVNIAYRATLSSSSTGDLWQFARLEGVMTAYRWIPWLSRPVRFDRPSVGEPWVTSTSPRVRATITTDRTLVIASSGRRVSVSGLTQTFEATNVRDFNFSAAPDYRRRTRIVDGKTVTFFFRTLPADSVLDWAARAMRDYTAKVGGYPYPQFNVAEVGPWAALESPSLIWLPRGLSARLLPWTVAHEVAHQWFYSVVGNDQALQPFADEAVSDFMARNLVNRWATSQCAPDDLDQSIYDLGRCYPWVIYVQGVAYLDRYRDTVGNTKFWRGLANYYARYRHRLGGTRQLLDALDASSGVDYPHEQRFPSLYP